MSPGGELPPGGERVLVVAEQLPLPVRGGADLRLLSVTKALSGFATVGVTALSAHDPPAPAHVALWSPGIGRLPNARANLRQALKQSQDPFGIWADPVRVLALRETVDRFAPTVVVCYRMRTWRVLDEALAAGTVPVVVDLDDTVARAARTIEDLHDTSGAMRIRLLFTRAQTTYERAVVDRADQVWVSSPTEAADLAGSTGRTDIDVVPNVVDVADYARPSASRRPRRVVFPATFAYPPNDDAARILLDEIAPLVPDVEIALVGSWIPDWLTARAGAMVTVNGPVDDMAAQLAASTVAVVPLRSGTGTRLKILECLAASTPVVSTAVGVEDLDLEPDRHYLRAESASEFAVAIRRLVDEPDLAASLADAGLVRVRERHSVEALVPVLRGLLDDASALTRGG